MVGARHWLALVIDRARGRRADVHVADGDEALVEEVAPLLDGEGMVDERLVVAGGIFLPVLGPALELGLVSVVAVVKGQFGERHRRWTDAQLDLAFVGLARPALAAVGTELGG